MICGGYSQVVDALASIEVQQNVQLQSIVKHVKWSREEPCELTLEDGSKLLADNVLMTIPLGCLKAGDVEFEPEFPPK